MWVWRLITISLGRSESGSKNYSCSIISNFFSWQLDGQWLHSFGEDHLLVTRLRGQLTDRLLTIFLGSKILSNGHPQAPELGLGVRMTKLRPFRYADNNDNPTGWSVFLSI